MDLEYMIVTSPSDPFVVVGALLTDGQEVVGVGSTISDLLSAEGVTEPIQNLLSNGESAEALAFVTRNSLYGTRDVNTLRGVESLDEGTAKIEEYLTSLGPFWVGGTKETEA